MELRDTKACRGVACSLVASEARRRFALGEHALENSNRGEWLAETFLELGGTSEGVVPKRPFRIRMARRSVEVAVASLFERALSFPESRPLVAKRFVELALFELGEELRAGGDGRGDAVYGLAACEVLAQGAWREPGVRVAPDRGDEQRVALAGSRSRTTRARSKLARAARVPFPRSSRS